MAHPDGRPTSTPSQDGEDHSRVAFRNLVEGPLFRICIQDQSDYGDDFQLAVRIPRDNGTTAETNFRLHAQLKSTTEPSNNDGSFSVTAPSHNLQYLHDPPHAIYVIFVCDSGKCYYRWADEVYADYESRVPDWRTKERITVRCFDNFDPTAVELIHTRMLAEAPREKELIYQVRRQLPLLSGTFTYDTETTKLIDHDKIANFLSLNGLTLARGGKPEEVLRLCDLLPTARLDDSAKLARACAAYLLSRVGIAFEALRECKSEGLHSDNDRAFHAFLDASLRRALDMLDNHQYVAEIDAITTRYPDSISAIHARLERLRHDAVNIDPHAALPELKAIAADLRGKGEEWAPLAAQAAFAELEIRYCSIHKRFIESLTAAAGVLHSQDLHLWVKDFELALAVAKNLKMDILVAEGLYMACACMTQETVLLDTLALNVPAMADGRSQRISWILVRLDRACAIFFKVRAMEQWGQAQLLVVEAHWLNGDQPRAIELARNVQAISEQERLIHIYHRASRVVSGKSPLKDSAD